MTTNLTPIPNTPLRDDPTEDAIWKRYLSQLRTNVNGVFDVAHGGTGISSYTIGDIIYASGATTLSKLADVAAGQVLVSGGVGVAPAWGSNVNAIFIKQSVGLGATLTIPSGYSMVIAGDYTVTGDLVVNGDMAVLGPVNAIVGDLGISGNLGVGGYSNVTGNARIAGTLSSGAQTITGNQAITGNQTIVGNETITGNLTVSGNIGVS